FRASATAVLRPMPDDVPVTRAMRAMKPPVARSSVGAQRRIDPFPNRSYCRPPMLRFGALTLAAGLCLTAPAHADDVLHPGAVNVDRPTLVTLGVQLLISGDDDHDAAVTVRYRETGAGTCRDAMPPFRVHPESVVGRTVPEQFAGSIF